MISPIFMVSFTLFVAVLYVWPKAIDIRVAFAWTLTTCLLTTL